MYYNKPHPFGWGLDANYILIHFQIFGNTPEQIKIEGLFHLLKKKTQPPKKTRILNWKTYILTRVCEVWLINMHAIFSVSN